MKILQVCAAIIRSIKFNRLKFNSLGVNVEWNGGVITDAHNINMGSYVYIGPGASIHGRGGITIGDGVILGPRVTIHSSNHNYETELCVPYDGGVCVRPVIVERGVWIGDSVIICPGVQVGCGAVIGAGSVLTRNVPSFSVVGGNPATVIKRRENYEKANNLIMQEKYYLKLKKDRKIKYFDIYSSNSRECS